MNGCGEDSDNKNKQQQHDTPTRVVGRKPKQQSSKVLNANPFAHKKNKASSSSSSSIRRFKSRSELLYTEDEDVDEEYVSFEDIRQSRYSRVRQYSKREERLITNRNSSSNTSNNAPHRSSTSTTSYLPLPNKMPPSDIIIHKSNSDDCSLTTLGEDSLTSLVGLNITLPPAQQHPVGGGRDDDRRASRAVQFKRVVMVQTYDPNEGPVCMKNIVDGLLKEQPSTVRKLGLFEKIALYEARPDLAPFYHHQWAADINKLVLAPTMDATLVTSEKVVKMGDEALRMVGGGTKAIANDNNNTGSSVKADSVTTSAGSMSCEVRQEAREYVESTSLLDVEGDSRDEMDEYSYGRDECEVEEESDEASVDVERLCRLYGPAGVDRILGCIKGE